MEQKLVDWDGRTGNITRGRAIGVNASLTIRYENYACPTYCGELRADEGETGLCFVSIPRRAGKNAYLEVVKSLESYVASLIAAKERKRAWEERMLAKKAERVARRNIKATA